MAESEHANLLNELDKMQQSHVYALRRDVLHNAERLIIGQERRIQILQEMNAELVSELDSLAEKIENAGWHESETEYARELIAKVKP